MLFMGKEKYLERISLGAMIIPLEKQGNSVTLASIKVTQVGFLLGCVLFLLPKRINYRDEFLI